MTGIQDLTARLKALEDDLKHQSVFLLPSDNDTSFGMLLLISDTESNSEPVFLRELYRVLVEKTTEFDDNSPYTRELKQQMEEWLGEEAKELHKPENWLKIKIEDYPLRLFVAIDPDQWKNEEHNPLESEFWDHRDQFFRKRICWLNNDLPEANSENGVSRSAKARQFSQKLRTRWIRHLAVNVSNVWEHKAKKPKLHILINLTGSDSSSIERLNPPKTVPAEWRDSEGKPPSEAQKGYFIFNLETSEIGKGSWISRVGVEPSNIEDNDRVMLCQRHRLPAEFVAKSSKWEPYWWLFQEINIIDNYHKWFFNKLCFQGAFSGAGRIFSVLDSALIARDVSDTSPTILDIAEQGLVRVGIADERFQEWLWQRSASFPEKERGWVISQRLLPVFFTKPGDFGQPPEIDSPHALLTFESNRDALKLKFPEDRFEAIWPSNGNWRDLDLLVIHQGLLDKAFDNEDTPQKLTARVLQMKDVFPFVFVTSGRGRPENLPFGCKFLPYASIEGSIHGAYFEKLILWRALGAL